MKTVGVPLGEDIIEKLDAMIADGSSRGQGFYRSRASVIRAAIRLFLTKRNSPAEPLREQIAAVDPTNPN